MLYEVQPEHEGLLAKCNVQCRDKASSWVPQAGAAAARGREAGFAQARSTPSWEAGSRAGEIQVGVSEPALDCGVKAEALGIVLTQGRGLTMIEAQVMVCACALRPVCPLRYIQIPRS